MKKRNEVCTSQSPSERAEQRTEIYTKRGHPYRGLFCQIDGPDGCGKSTQVNMLENYLVTRSYEVIRVRDPGGTRIGEMIRHILLDADNVEISPRVEFLLFEASRAQLVDEQIRPALEQGRIVLTDRFDSSTTAYQGAAGKVPMDLILYGNRVATDGIFPDRSFFLDLPYEIGLQRQGTELDRMERKKRYFHERVRDGFLGQAKLDPERITVIDATQDPETIHQQIVEDLERYMDQHKLRDKLLRTSRPS